VIVKNQWKLKVESYIMLYAYPCFMDQNAGQ